MEDMEAKEAWAWLVPSTRVVSLFTVHGFPQHLCHHHFTSKEMGSEIRGFSKGPGGQVAGIWTQHTKRCVHPMSHSGVEHPSEPFSPG